MLRRGLDYAHGCHVCLRGQIRCGQMSSSTHCLFQQTIMKHMYKGAMDGLDKYSTIGDKDTEKARLWLKFRHQCELYWLRSRIEHWGARDIFYPYFAKQVREINFHDRILELFKDLDRFEWTIQNGRMKRLFEWNYPSPIN